MWHASEVYTGTRKRLQEIVKLEKWHGWTSLIWCINLPEKLFIHPRYRKVVIHEKQHLYRQTWITSSNYSFLARNFFGIFYTNSQNLLNIYVFDRECFRNFFEGLLSLNGKLWQLVKFSPLASTGPPNITFALTKIIINGIL